MNNTFIRNCLLVAAASSMITNVLTFLHGLGVVNFPFIDDPTIVLGFRFIIGFLLAIAIGFELVIRKKVIQIPIYLFILLPVIIFDYLVGCIVVVLYFILIKEKKNEPRHDEVIDDLSSLRPSSSE